MWHTARNPALSPQPEVVRMTHSPRRSFRVARLLAAAALAASMGVTLAPPALAAEPAEEKLDLEEYFPEDSIFGPSANVGEFSHDGRFAAFLYRPYDERRHGADLYVYDTQTGKSRRLTSASRLSEFQADARKVVDDRIERLKKAKDERYLAMSKKADGDDADAAEPSVAGTYAGTASEPSDNRLADDTPVRLTIEDGRRGMTGELIAGLIRLPLRNVKAEESNVTADVGTEGDSIEGTLLGEVGDAGAMTGTLTLTKPEFSFKFSAEREAATTRPATTQGAEYARGILEAEAEIIEPGDLVPEGDADERRMPRYGGVQSVEWSPTASEMLVMSDGDIYRLTLDPSQWETAEGEEPYRGELERLTRTRERESSVAYLPSGGGYTYLRDGALLRVSFGDSNILQLDPPLEDGERMVGYRISPDEDRLVFLASKSNENAEAYENVTIVRYRERFAQAQQVRRLVADADVPTGQTSIYLYDLTGHEREDGQLQRVFTRTTTGPRDVMFVPEWSPDSSKVAFAAFEQSSGEVSILEAGFDLVEQEATEETAPTEPDGERRQREMAEADQSAQQDDDVEQIEQEQIDVPTSQPATSQPAPEPEFTIENARVVYRFLHNGGPNTPRMIVPRYLPDSRHMAFITELSGFRHIHVLDPVYERLEQVTTGMLEVYPFDQSADHERLFMTATVENDPASEWAYELDLTTRELRRLDGGEGVVEQVAVSDDGEHALVVQADFGAPREMKAFDAAEGGEMEATTLSDFHPEIAHEKTSVKPEYFAFENRHGQTIHGHMFKPSDWTPADKRPLLMYVYGGPLGERKMITRGAYSGPSYFFARYMAEQHGWVTATVDPRGASGFGAVFEKANFQRVGEPQTEDLVDAADWLVENAGVDREKRALHGWSFGGFQTQMTMYTEPKAFAVGIAGAGPTEWVNYNAWYTTGTVGTKAGLKEDAEQFSLLPLAKNLEGRLLLIHGMEDSNVLYQDTVRVYRELLQAHKGHLVDLFLDPTGGHGLGGDVNTLDQYRKYHAYLVQHLGEGEPAPQPEADDEPTTAPATQPATRPVTRPVGILQTSPDARPTTRATTRSAE